MVVVMSLDDLRAGKRLQGEAIAMRVIDGPATVRSASLASALEANLEFDLDPKDEVTAHQGTLFLGARPLPPLPQKLTPGQAARLAEIPNILGIKDSSGSLDILRHLTKHGVQACRIVGDDVVLATALREGICDGVVLSMLAGLLKLDDVAAFGGRDGR